MSNPDGIAEQKRLQVEQVNVELGKEPSPSAQYQFLISEPSEEALQQSLQRSLGSEPRFDLQAEDVEMKLTNNGDATTYNYTRVTDQGVTTSLEITTRSLNGKAELVDSRSAGPRIRILKPGSNLSDEFGTIQIGDGTQSDQVIIDLDVFDARNLPIGRLALDKKPYSFYLKGGEMVVELPNGTIFSDVNGDGTISYGESAPLAKVPTLIPTLTAINTPTPVDTATIIADTVTPSSTLTPENSPTSVSTLLPDANDLPDIVATATLTITDVAPSATPTPAPTVMPTATIQVDENTQNERIYLPIN